MLLKALLVYGLLMLLAGSTVALTCFLAYSVTKAKALEARLMLLEDMLDELEKKSDVEMRKLRRLLTESVSGVGESVTRAVLMLAETGKKVETEHKNVEEADISEGDVELSGELTEQKGGILIPASGANEHIGG